MDRSTQRALLDTVVVHLVEDEVLSALGALVGLVIALDAVGAALLADFWFLGGL